MEFATLWCSKWTHKSTPATCGRGEPNHCFCFFVISVCFFFRGELNRPPPPIPRYTQDPSIYSDPNIPGTQEHPEPRRSQVAGTPGTQVYPGSVYNRSPGRPQSRAYPGPKTNPGLAHSLTHSLTHSNCDRGVASNCTANRQQAANGLAPARPGMPRETPEDSPGHLCCAHPLQKP